MNPMISELLAREHQQAMVARSQRPTGTVRRGKGRLRTGAGMTLVWVGLRVARADRAVLSPVSPAH